MIVTPVKSRNADKPTPVAFIGGLLALFPQGAAVVAEHTMLQYFVDKDK